MEIIYHFEGKAKGLVEDVRQHLTKEEEAIALCNDILEDLPE